MASFALHNRFRLLVLVGAGACISFCAFAQIPSQNLFRRSQFIEFYRLRNQARISSGLNSLSGPINGNRISSFSSSPGTSPANGMPVEFEIKCTTAPVIYKDWIQGETFFAFSRWLDAELIYSSLIKNDSAFCDAYFRLAQTHVAQNNLSAGYNILTIAKKKFPDNPQLYVGLGQLYTLLSYPKTALYYFQKQTILFPKDADGFLGTSWTLAELGREKDALFYLDIGRNLLIADMERAGIATVSVSVDYLYVFESMLYNRLHENEKSLQALRHLKSNGNNDDIINYSKYLRGMYFYNKGEEFYGRAIKNLKKAAGAGIWVDEGIVQHLGMRFDPNDFRAVALREQYNDKLKIESLAAPTPKADSVFQNRLLEAASELYSAHLKTDTANCHVLLRLAECYRGLEKHREALALYQSAMKYYPHEIRLQLLLARQLLQVGEVKESIDAYQQANRLDRKDFRGYYGACLAMAHLGQYQNSLDALRLGENFGKNNKGRSSILKAILYNKVGLYVSSLETFAISKKIRKNGMAKYYRGLAHHFLDEDELAASDIFEAIQLGANVSPETIEMVGLDPKNPQFALH